MEAQKLTERRRVVTEGGRDARGNRAGSETVHYLVSPATLAVDSRLRIETPRPQPVHRAAVPWRARSWPASSGTKRTRWKTAAASKPVRAWLVLGLGDNRGVQAMTLNVDGRPVTAEPGTRVGWLPEGLHAPVPLAALDQPFAFDVALDLTGTQSPGLAAGGLGNHASPPSADWPHPGFEGRHLPQASKITDEGFSANWAVSRLSSRGAAGGRGLPAAPTDCAGLAESGFGVRLVEPWTAT